MYNINFRITIYELRPVRPATHVENHSFM